jgi:AAA15 family ATPase/GTPase
MTSLILNSLEIREFRAFKHIRINGLGQVNLIVGKNNVGKSSILEALRIYAHRGSLALIQNILRERDEVRLNTRSINNISTQINAMRYLFHGMSEMNDDFPVIKIGPLNVEDQTLSLRLNSIKQLSFLSDIENEVNESIREDVDIYSKESSKSISFELMIQYGLNNNVVYPIYRGSSGSISSYAPLNIPLINYSFIPSGGLTKRKLARLWDNVILTDLEALVISSLQIIAPELERLNFLLEGERDPIPVVRLKNLPTRVPLGSLGEGMNRMFGIALSLVDARDGILLIDEIESGLHYSVQTDMWRLIFETARRLNIQVVATTHSWDCIQGFQQAAQEDKLAEGVLIRLGRRKGDIVSTVYSEEELEIVTREQIEVR